jgi:hypothetical protein
MEQHGISLTTLLGNCENLNGGPCLLAIKDDKHYVFGAYLSDAIHRNPEGTFYGNGSCFLWSTHGTSQVSICMSFLTLLVLTQHSEANVLNRTDKASGLNEDYMTFMVNPLSFAIGAGPEGFGLWVDDTFENGQSRHCPTFNNKDLASHDRFFVLGLEVWELPL